MRSYRPLLACILLLEVSATGAGAQQLPPFAGGDTVRVHAPRVALKHARVTFVAWGDSTLRVDSRRGDTTVAVPFAEVMRLDRYAGKNRLKGALRGAGILGTIGFWIGFAIGDGEVSGCQEFLCEMDAFRYAGYGMLAGMALGIPVGAASMAPDRWRRVELPVTLGFPPYRTPFHETLGFQVLGFAASMLLFAAMN